MAKKVLKEGTRAAIRFLAERAVDDAIRNAEAEKASGKPRKRTRLNKKGAERLLWPAKDRRPNE